MADENLDMESVRISELDQTTEVDREKDYLVVSRHSDAYIDDEKSFKITPDDLLDGVGVNYNAGAHIAIDNNTHTISATYTNATTSADGLMSKEDKSTVDSLQPVATSGDYSDLTNKPTIPAAQVNSDWNSTSGVSEILNKPTLATVATTGDYADLSNTPIIPDAISDLTDDVSITNPENDEVLKYDATSSKWINAAAPAGASALSGLTDVAISTPLNNQALLYDNTTHTWINKAVEGTVPVKDTASGQIATFETNMADVLQEVKCEINATGGNGTPDNPNPINGFTEANITRCGVNLWDEEWEVGGYNNITGTPTLETDRIRNKNHIPCKGGSSVHITYPSGVSGGIYVYFWDSTDTLISVAYTNSGNSFIFTTPADTAYFNFNTQSYYGATYNDNLSFNYPSTDTTYHPYTGNTYAVSFGQAVYGGQLIIMPDRTYMHVTHGKYTGTWGDGSGDYTPDTMPDIKRRTFTLSPQGGDVTANNGHSKTNITDVFSTSNALNSPHFYVYDNLYLYAPRTMSDSTPVECSFALATPFDIDLTPEQIEALIGINNVWHDGNGNTEVKYYTSTAKDIKDFIKTSIDVDDLADVTITAPVENQVLKYNGTQWVNATSPAGATNLDGLTDVTIATPTAGQALVYNGTSGEWENKAVDYANIANKPTLSTVATSGSYTDLSNTPTIPAAQVNADWDSTSGVSEILNKPTIPTVNDAMITVVQGSTTKGTFTLNQSTNATITLDAGGSGGASALDDLTDVDITTPTDGQTLVYDGTNSKWINGAGGGGSAKQTAITQAEYNALVQAGTVDPTMEYFITDGIPSSVEYYHNYSTDEQIVGTWIDGSTVYEKTFDIRANAETISDTLFTDLQISKIIDLYLMLYAGYVFQKSLNISYNVSTNKLTINEGTKYVQFITVRYTKST